MGFFRTKRWQGFYSLKRIHSVDRNVIYDFHFGVLGGDWNYYNGREACRPINEIHP